MTLPSHDLTPQQTSRHQNTSLQSTKHHHHGTAEGSFTAKKWLGHRAGRSPCAHSIGKFFLCYIVLFLLETSAPGLSGHYWYIMMEQYRIEQKMKIIWCRYEIRFLPLANLLNFPERSLGFTIGQFHGSAAQDLLKALVSEGQVSHEMGSVVNSGCEFHIKWRCLEDWSSKPGGTITFFVF